MMLPMVTSSTVILCVNSERISVSLTDFNKTDLVLESSIAIDTFRSAITLPFLLKRKCFRNQTKVRSLAKNNILQYRYIKLQQHQSYLNSETATNRSFRPLNALKIYKAHNFRMRRKGTISNHNVRFFGFNINEKYLTYSFFYFESEVSGHLRCHIIKFLLVFFIGNCYLKLDYSNIWK